MTKAIGLTFRIDSPTIDIAIYNKRNKEIVAKQ